MEYLDHPVEGALLGGSFAGLGEYLKLMEESFDRREFLGLLMSTGIGVGSFFAVSGLLGSVSENMVLSFEIALNLAGLLSSIANGKFWGSTFSIGLGIGLGLGIAAEGLQYAATCFKMDFPDAKDPRQFFANGLDWFKIQAKIASGFSVPAPPGAPN